MNLSVGVEIFILFILLVYKQLQHWLQWRTWLGPHRSIENLWGDILELVHKLWVPVLASANTVVLAAHEIHHIAAHGVDNGFNIINWLFSRNYTLGAVHLFWYCKDAVLKYLKRAAGELNLSILATLTDVLQMSNERVHTLVRGFHVFRVGTGH